MRQVRDVAALQRWAAVARDKWAAIAPQVPERLVGPHTPAFRCRPHDCDAMCCRAPYLAGASERDVARLHDAGHATLTFLDIDPATLDEMLGHRLRWSEVVSLRQTRAGACTFLQDDLACGAYADRPDGCAQYPHRLIFVPADGDRIATHVDSVEALDRSVRIALGWQPGDPAYVPLLLRDTACPGFTEPPLGLDGYAALLERVWSLDACASHAWPCERHESLA